MVWCGTGELSDLERLRFVIFILALMNHKVLNQVLGVKFFTILHCFCIKTCKREKTAKMNYYQDYANSLTNRRVNKFTI